ncbi:hypothetical protein [Actinoallomurus sp. NPDC050550]|uniref:hypothetical protein n=1 Tax=Actinoallomurus sp. NPDC050550 TaxID=3154937 RepID=UPI0033E6FFDE
MDTGTTSGVTFTAGALNGLGWSASSTTVGATGVSYTFTFTTATTSLTISSITMSVPPGTTGTPTLGSVTPSGLGGSVSLSGTTLTYSGISLLPLVPTAFSIQVNGLTNTSTAGTYTSEIVTKVRALPSTPTSPGRVFHRHLEPRRTELTDLGCHTDRNRPERRRRGTAADQQFSVGGRSDSERNPAVARVSLVGRIAGVGGRGAA